LLDVPPQFCSIKITQAFRDFASTQMLAPKPSWREGGHGRMGEAFREKGGEICLPAAK
jgi:hypothetical protein